jgi:hypothetical protein
MAIATTANGTSATATATGGNGDFAGRGGTGHPVPGAKLGQPARIVGGPGGDSVAGDGGNAIVDATSTNKAGNSTATSNAAGGNGGVLGPAGVAVIGKPGSAMARATATASGNATADPTATIGKGTGGIAVAVGNATGNGSKATDNGFGISDGKTRKVNGRAVANIPAGAMGNVQGQGQAAIAATLPALTPNTTLNAFGSAIAQPLISAVLGTSATAPIVVSALEVDRPNSDQLGLVSLSGLYPEGGSGPRTSFTGSAAYSFDPTQLPGEYLLVGLHDGLATGKGVRFAWFSDPGRRRAGRATGVHLRDRGAGVFRRRYPEPRLSVRTRARSGWAA